MKEKLTLGQFQLFASQVWPNFPEWDLEDEFDNELWIAIAGFENNRSFQEGWPLCPSKLTWEYTTTSGTVISVSQQANRPAEITVEIPQQDRCQPGRIHYGLLRAVLAGCRPGTDEWDEILTGKIKEQREAEHEANKARWASWGSEEAYEGEFGEEPEDYDEDDEV